MIKGKILVVDADEDIRRMLTGYFTGLGYEVTTFANLSEVVESGNPENVDIVILEVEDALALNREEKKFLES